MTWMRHLIVMMVLVHPNATLCVPPALNVPNKRDIESALGTGGVHVGGDLTDMW